MYYKIYDLFGINKEFMPFIANTDEEFAKCMNEFINSRRGKGHTYISIEFPKDKITFLKFRDVKSGMEHSIAVIIEEITKEEYCEILLD